MPHSFRLFFKISTNLCTRGSRCPLRLTPSPGNGLSALVQRRNICHIADARTSSFLRPPAQLELTPRKTLSLAVLITPPNVACVRACLPACMNNVCVPACVFATQALPPPTHKLTVRSITNVPRVYDRRQFSEFLLRIQAYILYTENILSKYLGRLITMSLRGFEIQETRCFRCGTFEGLI